MKKMFFILMAAILFYPAAAQKVTIKEYEDNSQKGYLTFLEKDPATVGKFINDYFRQFGKVKFRENIYTLTELSHRYFPFPEIIVFTKIKEVDGTTKTSFWIADSLMSLDVYKEKLQKLAHVFSVDFYKAMKQQEIDESLRALRFAEKQYQKFERDSLGLQNDIKKNIEEKAKLEQALKDNELNKKALEQKIIDNKADKDSLIITLEKIKRLIEVKEREKKAIE